MLLNGGENEPLRIFLAELSVDFLFFVTFLSKDLSHRKVIMVSHVPTGYVLLAQQLLDRDTILSSCLYRQGLVGFFVSIELINSSRVSHIKLMDCQLRFMMLRRSPP